MHRKVPIYAKQAKICLKYANPPFKIENSLERGLKMLGKRVKSTQPIPSDYTLY